MLKGKILIIWKVFQGSIVFIVCIVFVYFIIDIDNDNKVLVQLDSCIDGDTAWFIVDGKREKVRFLGIDTPESTTIQEEYGKEASNYTCTMLESAKNIYLQFDFNSDKKDKYGRLLGYVFVDNNNLNELLLKEGLAEVKYIYGDYKYIDNFCDSQYKAYLDKLNIWQNYDYNSNYCYSMK